VKVAVLTAVVVGVLAHVKLLVTSVMSVWLVKYIIITMGLFPQRKDTKPMHQ
jgi:hypothetical protein